MKTIEQLRALMTALVAQMTTLQQTAEAAKRDFTPEESATIDKLTAEFEATKAEVERREKIEHSARYLQESAGRRTTTRADVVVGRDRRELDGMAGFRSPVEFAMAVRAACGPGGRVDQRLTQLQQGNDVTGIQNAPSGYHQENVASDAGFLVPADMREAIFSLVFPEEASDIIDLVTLEPTGSNQVEMMGDESTPWGATGVKAKWRTEASQMTATGKVPTDPRTTKLHELYAFVLATDEVLQDAPLLGSRIVQQAARAIRWEASEAFMWGKGVGKPLGFMESACLVSVAKESGQAASTIVRQNLLKMLARLLRMGGTPLWLANSDTLPALGELNLGNNGLFFLPQTGFSQAPSSSLLGVPILYTEHCKTLGTQGDLVLCDLQGYFAAQRAGGVKFDTSIHLFFDYGQQAFRWTFRIGGQPFLKAAVTPANGSNTKSHFVTLADRA